MSASRSQIKRQADLEALLIACDASAPGRNAKKITVAGATIFFPVVFFGHIIPLNHNSTLQAAARPT